MAWTALSGLGRTNWKWGATCPSWEWEMGGIVAAMKMTTTTRPAAAGRQKARALSCGLGCRRGRPKGQSVG